jgi:hypothetical protein
MVLLSFNYVKIVTLFVEMLTVAGIEPGPKGKGADWSAFTSQNCTVI